MIEPGLGRHQPRVVRELFDTERCVSAVVAQIARDDPHLHDEAVGLASIDEDPIIRLTRLYDLVMTNPSSVTMPETTYGRLQTVGWRVAIAAQNTLDDIHGRSPTAQKLLGFGVLLIGYGLARFGHNALAGLPEPDTISLVATIGGVACIGRSGEESIWHS